MVVDGRQRGHRGHDHRPMPCMTWSPTYPAWVSGARSANVSSGKASRPARSRGPDLSATTAAGPGKRIKWSRHGRVVAAEPGKEFSFATEEGGRESTKWTYRFESIEGGTRVTESYGVQWLPAWARILDGPLNRKGELHRHMRHTLEQLKAAAEAAEATGKAAEATGKAAEAPGGPS